MPQRTSFTTISPLPSSIRRAQAVAFLQDHLNMIDLNPLVKRRVPIEPPDHCPDDERHCTWYSITDSISYLPGGLYDGEVHYTAAFHDLPGEGMQSHSYAAMGVEIQGKWTVGGNERGEKPGKREIGSEAPSEGLYLKEECEVKCNLMMTRFIKKTILKSHGKLMNSLVEKAALYPTGTDNQESERRGRTQRPPHVHPGRSPAGRSASPSLPSPTEPSARWGQASPWGNLAGTAQGWHDSRPQRPYATSSDLYLAQQQERRGQGAYQSQRPHAGNNNSNYLYYRRDNTPSTRPSVSPESYLGQQPQGHHQDHQRPYHVYSNTTNAAAAPSTSGLHLYSNGPHQGGRSNGGAPHSAQQDERQPPSPPAYAPGPTRQLEFAELA